MEWNKFVFVKVVNSLIDRCPTWWSIPQRHDLMRISVAGDTFCTRQAEIREFELAAFAYQQVLWLHVAMEDASLMAIGQATEQLEEKEADISMIETTGVPFHVL